MFWGDDPERYTDLYRISKEILDLTETQASELFYARGSEAEMEDVTVDMAIVAIDTLIKDGTPDWSSVL